MERLTIQIECDTATLLKRIEVMSDWVEKTPDGICRMYGNNVAPVIDIGKDVGFVRGRVGSKIIVTAIPINNLADALDRFEALQI